MASDTIQLSPKWKESLLESPETGMGYHVVSVVLKDGTRYNQVAVVGAFIAEIKGRDDIPFIEDDIHEIVVTHDKWDFGHNK